MNNGIISVDLRYLLNLCFSRHSTPTELSVFVVNYIRYFDSFSFILVISGHCTNSL